MSDKHLSSQFDADLNAVSSKVLEMGGPSSRRSSARCTR